MQRRFILWRTFGETTLAGIAICAFGREIGFGFLGLDVGGAEAGHLGHPRHAVASRRFDPPRIDNLHHVAGRGIIPDGLAATTITIDRQIPAWHAGGMDR